MTKKSEIIVTSFDPDSLKESLISYLSSKEGFEDINYEGSAINTMIDLLVRNSVYTSYQANMVANESFLDSAQIRGNVSSHAQKLSYLPRSRTASRVKVNLTVNPASFNNLKPTIVADAGSIFLYTDGSKTYTFSTISPITLSYNINEGKYFANDIILYQGKIVKNTVKYTGEKIIIKNTRVDTSTLMVYADTGEGKTKYVLADSLSDLSSENPVYFLRENPSGFYEIEFGKNIVGIEPALNADVDCTYINTENDHANGADEFKPASSIEGFSNIVVEVIDKAYGGYDRDSIEEIRFLAPKLYRSQNRAVSPSDYEAIIKQHFPFIRNIRAWGGEENVPPKYGVTILSIITEDGFFMTSTLEEEIKKVLREKSVASITPEIISPDVFVLNLTLNYKLKPEYNSSLVTSEVESYLKQTTKEYSSVNLLKFSSYYNEYELIGRLQTNNNIETVVIEKTVSIDVKTSRFKTDSYEINFGNAVEPNSFYVTKFKCTTCPNEIIVDDGKGKIFHNYYVNGFLQKIEVGEINYETGYLFFDIEFIQDDEIITAIATPTEPNFNTRLNGIVKIGEIETNKIV